MLLLPPWYLSVTTVSDMADENCTCSRSLKHFHQHWLSQQKYGRVEYIHYHLPGAYMTTPVAAIIMISFRGANDSHPATTCSCWQINIMISFNWSEGCTYLLTGLKVAQWCQDWKYQNLATRTGVAGRESLAPRKDIMMMEATGAVILAPGKRGPTGILLLLW